MPAKQAPGYNSPQTLECAEALVALLNTRPHARYEESLVPGADSEDILGRFAGGKHAGPPDLDAVGRLRDALFRTLDEDPADQERAWSEVSELLSSVTFKRVFTPSEVRLRPVAGDAVLGGIAAAVHTVVEANGWSRLRVCPNHLCDMAFYDATRSRTQKWDSFETCGNKANVAAHRARLREREGN